MNNNYALTVMRLLEFKAFGGALSIEQLFDFIRGRNVTETRESKPKKLRHEAKYVHNGGRFDAAKISRHLTADGESINTVF